MYAIYLKICVIYLQLIFNNCTYHAEPYHEKYKLFILWKTLNPKILLKNTFIQLS